MAPQWTDDEAHLLRLWLYHTVPGGLNQERKRLTWKNVTFRMNEEARTKGITEKNIQYTHDHESLFENATACL